MICGQRSAVSAFSYAIDDHNGTVQPAASQIFCSQREFLLRSSTTGTRSISALRPRIAAGGHQKEDATSRSGDEPGPSDCDRRRGVARRQRKRVRPTDAEQRRSMLSAHADAPVQPNQNPNGSRRPPSEMGAFCAISPILSIATDPASGLGDAP